MDREELENFIADLLAMGRGQLERLSGNDLWRLAQIRCEFMVAAGEDPPHIVRQRQNQRRTLHVFPVGFPHLNWDSHGTMNREELKRFMEMFNALPGEQTIKISYEDIARLHERVHLLGASGTGRWWERQRNNPVSTPDQRAVFWGGG
jgi:hypothetical protein